jgi:TRAP-type C4-dicarboxylate transport system permease small subunit
MTASNEGQRAPGVLGQLARLCIVVAGISLCGMAIVQGWQVFARYVLNDSPSWTEPTALLCMNFAMMFGAAAGVHAGAHFGFYIVPQSARGAARKLLLAFAHLVCAAIALLAAVWAARLVADGWDIPLAGAPLPQGLQYLPLACAGALMALFCAAHLVRTVRHSSASE